jgi:hypothetical protein
MITNDIKDYEHLDGKEHFKAFVKDYCIEWCWGNGFGDCSICKQNQAIIEKAFDEMVGEDK